MNGNKVFVNIIWRFAERIGAKIISVVVQLILARLLAPEVFGTVAIVIVITDILQVFIESGFGTALIQKKDSDDLDFSSVFYFNIVVSIILYIILFILSPTLASLYENDELTAIFRTVGLILPISGLRNIQQAYISKHMLFKRFFYASLAGTIIAGTIGIIMAYNGYGVWAYITQYLINNFISTCILWFTVKWRPMLAFSLERLRVLFGYGWKLLASSLLNTISDKIRPLIIGYQYTASDLAYYNEGVLFPNLIVENVNTSIDSVLLPALSEQQESTAKVKQMTKRAISVSSYIMWPLMIGLFACSKQIVLLILTEKWLPCVEYIQIFCIYYALFPIHTANLNAIKSLGRSDIFLKLEIIKKILDLIVILCTIFISVKAMALGLLLEGFINLFINSLPTNKLIGYSFKEQLSDIFPAFFAAVIMGIIVYSINYLPIISIMKLLLQIILGIIVYICLSNIMKIDTYVYLKELIQKIISKRKLNSDD